MMDVNVITLQFVYFISHLKTMWKETQAKKTLVFQSKNLDLNICYYFIRKM